MLYYLPHLFPIIAAIVGATAYFFLLRAVPKSEPVSTGAPVDFRDGTYNFQRAVDGDTIVVSAPDALSGWVKDIRVRLYGLEVPELWEDDGVDYRKHLDDLCGIDANAKLHIVWERQRLNTQYPGFPQPSFNREVGHVFFRCRNGRYLYINGLMHLLPHATYYRENKILLRGRRYLREMDYPDDFCDRCLAQFEVPINASSTLRYIAGLDPPSCFLEFSTLPSLDPRVGIDPAFLSKHCCGGQRVLQQTIQDGIEMQRLSMFDWPLAVLYRWRRAKSPLRSTNHRNPPIPKTMPLSKIERDDFAKLQGLNDNGNVMTSAERARFFELLQREAVLEGPLIDDTQHQGADDTKQPLSGDELDEVKKLQWLQEDGLMMVRSERARLSELLERVAPPAKKR